MYVKNLILVVFVVVLTSCASIPNVLQGEFADITPAKSKVNHVMNINVRWSGYIIQTVNKKDKTCFEIVQTQTNKNLRPVKIIPKNSSRFIACKEGFLEPHAFDKRMVTITGNLVAYTEQSVGEYQYEYPVVKTDLIYIWRKQAPHANYSYFNTFASFSHFRCGYSFLHGYCY
ncbi:hypothetical protein MNBD_GAMMA01-346 [hydrothermal vent metagenome]|uniref:Starvation lipoprotein Slp paralog n=1 Tax=hydrothermal vent metagenome TaxID=652676 RepID=A0A3B0V8K0_9ZZZZ